MEHPPCDGDHTLVITWTLVRPCMGPFSFVVSFFSPYFQLLIWYYSAAVSAFYSCFTLAVSMCEISCGCIPRQWGLRFLLSILDGPLFSEVNWPCRPELYYLLTFVSISVSCYRNSMQFSKRIHIVHNLYHSALHMFFS